MDAARLFARISVAGAASSGRELQQFGQTVDKTQTNLNKIGHGAGNIAGGFAKISAAAAIAGIGLVTAGTKIATDFQAQMELIKTQAGASQDEVVAQSKAVQDLVHSVGMAPTELARGLYHIESVGVRGAAAMDILKASALGAKVGLADMESTTNALTAVWFSGIKGAKSMTDAMAILDGIVGVGNMHLQDLTDSFKSGILGTSATFGVDIKSIGAAIAALTDAGIPADIATTRLNTTLSHMAAPVHKGVDALKSIGISQFQLANDLRKPDGLFVAFKDLHDHLEAAGQVKGGLLTPQGANTMTQLFGGSKFGASAMQLITSMDRVQAKYDLINTRAASFGDNVAKTMDTAGFKFGQFHADIENAALAFGQGLLPAIARAAMKLDGFVVGNMDNIRKIGSDIGDAIDKINWTQVEDGAKSVVDVAKTLLGIIKQFPPELDLAVAAFLGLNTVTRGAASQIVGGALDVAKGAAGLLLRTAGGLVGGKVGGALGAITATPVYVVNFPPGMGLGGAAGAGAEGAAAGGLGLISKVFLVGEAIGLALLVNDVRQGIADASTKTAQAVHDQATSWLDHSPSREDLLNGLKGVDDGINKLQADPAAVLLVTGGALDQMKQTRAEILAKLAALPNKSDEDRYAPPRVPGKTQDDLVVASNAANNLMARGLTQGHRDMDKLDGSVLSGTAKMTAALDKLPTTLGRILGETFVKARADVHHALHWGPTTADDRNDQQRFIAAHADRTGVLASGVLTEKFLRASEGKGLYANIPFYNDTHKMQTAIAAMQRQQAAFYAKGDTKSAAIVGHDIDVLTGVLRHKNTSPHVSLTTQTIVNLDSQVIENKILRRNMAGGRFGSAIS